MSKCENPECANEAKPGRRFCGYSCSNRVTALAQWRKNPNGGNTRKPVVETAPAPRSAVDLFLLGGGR